MFAFTPNDVAHPLKSGWALRDVGFNYLFMDNIRAIHVDTGGTQSMSQSRFWRGIRRLTFTLRILKFESIATSSIDERNGNFHVRSQRPQQQSKSVPHELQLPWQTVVRIHAVKGVEDEIDMFASLLHDLR
jgi:phage terminase large subunit GpA-like protein